jgi:hypothetical protein
MLKNFVGNPARPQRCLHGVLRYTERCEMAEMARRMLKSDAKVLAGIVRLG